MAIVSLEFIKSYFGISDGSLDGKINVMIPLVEADYQLIQNKSFDKDSGDNIIYPSEAQETAALMVMYKINNTNKINVSGGSVEAQQPVQSESWGDHSISYQNGKDALNQSGKIKYGYSADIISRITRYVGFKAV